MTCSSDRSPSLLTGFHLLALLHSGFLSQFHYITPFEKPGLWTLSLFFHLSSLSFTFVLIHPSCTFQFHTFFYHSTLSITSFAGPHFPAFSSRSVTFPHWWSSDELKLRIDKYFRFHSWSFNGLYQVMLHWLVPEFIMWSGQECLSQYLL